MQKHQLHPAARTLAPHEVYESSERREQWTYTKRRTAALDNKVAVRVWRTSDGTRRTDGIPGTLLCSGRRSLGGF